MNSKGDLEKLLRPFELVDRAIASTSCYMHIYKRINALGSSMKIKNEDDRALHAVRAAALTSATALIVACLDINSKSNRDRSSIGGLIYKLNTKEYRDFFLEYHNSPIVYDNTVRSLKHEFDACRNGEDFKNVKRLRDNKIAHILDKDDTPTVPYDCLDRLFECVKSMFDLAYSALAHAARSQYGSLERQNEETGDWFVKTYVKGMKAQGSL